MASIKKHLNLCMMQAILMYFPVSALCSEDIAFIGALRSSLILIYMAIYNNQYSQTCLRAFYAGNHKSHLESLH